ncbi:brain-specific homeobox protein-like [Tropilaelaps mercedesae]|uniref:Brain-specific homeobox protein-like n=1 Tax=Tropilaelaps mercedesae TaxID=418985 RepID=A0A1V9WZQ6_9ACAR|nr:brain-specific homeobox protein-like [Tropilaelaps mercedesae]
MRLRALFDECSGRVTMGINGTMMSPMTSRSLRYRVAGPYCPVMSMAFVLLIGANVVIAGDTLTQRDIDSVRNKFEQDRNVTVSTHIDVVPATATTTLDSSRRPSGQPVRFDPLPVITTGSGNAIAPNRLAQSSRDSFREYYVQGQCTHPTSYDQCVGFMACCLMHRIPPPCNVLKPCGVMSNTMSCVDMPPIRHLFPSP